MKKVEIVFRKLGNIVLWLLAGLCLYACMASYHAHKYTMPPIIAPLQWIETAEALSVRTTLRSRGDIAQAIQELKGYNTYEIANFIAIHEGFSEIPFPDPSGIGKVIGFGFEPRGRTYMSRKEGISILNAEVERLIKKVIPVYGHVSQDKMTALCSILFNTPTYQRVIKDDNVVEAMKAGDVEAAKKHFHHSLRGIRIRRDQELALFFNNHTL